MCAKFHENQTKTVKVAKEIVFHRPSARHSLPIPLIGIEQVLAAKLLGVTCCSNLKFDDHVYFRL